MSINDQDVSSTEKLLKVIRGKDAGENPLGAGPARKTGLFSGIREKFAGSGACACLGVEILRDAIHIVRTERIGGSRRIVYASAEPVAPGTGMDHDDFGPFLARCIRKAASPGEAIDVWACIPASKGESWTVRVPKIRKNLGNAVYWSARKDKTFDDREVVFDYRIAGETTENDVRKLLAEVCTVSAADVRRYRELFAGIGFPLKGLTLSSYAMENLLESGLVEPVPDVYAVLSIGGQTSWIDIHTRERMLFSRVIRTGKDSVLESLMLEYDRMQESGDEIVITLDPPDADESAAEPVSPEQPRTGSRGLKPDGSDQGAHETGGAGDSASGLSPEDASRLLKSWADTTDNKTGGREQGLTYDQVFGMIEPALERLSRQMERTIDHSVNVLGNPAPAKIFVGGGLAFLPKIGSFFREQLDVPVEILDVLDPSSSGAAPTVFVDDPEDRLALVSAAGLAMPSGKTVNFLHTAYDRDKERAAARTTGAVAAGCAALFILAAGWWWYSLYNLDQARERAAQLESRLNAFSPRLSVDLIMEMAGKQREAQLETARYSRRLHPVAVMGEINRLTPENIQLVTMDIQLGDIRPERAGDDRRRTGGRALVLEGIIMEDPAGYEARLASYIRQLGASPLIGTVSIRRAQTDAGIMEEAVYRFTLNIELTEV